MNKLDNKAKGVKPSKTYVNSALEKDKSVEVINKKLDEASKYQYKFIDKSHHRAFKQVEANIQRINQEAQKIDQLKLERQDTYGLWEQVIAKHNRLIPKFYKEQFKSRKVGSAPIKRSHFRYQDGSRGKYSARAPSGRRDFSAKLLSREIQSVDVSRLKIRPKTRYISSARYSERNFKTMPPSFGLASWGDRDSNLRIGSGTVSQRRLHFLSRSYLELGEQVRLDRQKSGRSLLRDIQNQMTPSDSSCYSGTTTNLAASSYGQRTDSLRLGSVSVPLTVRERKIHRILKKVEIDCLNIREKVKLFCEQLDKFVLLDHDQEEVRILDDGYAIGMM